MFKAIFLIAIVLFTIFYIKYRFKEDRGFLIGVFTVALTLRIICATAIFLFSWHQGYGGFYSGDESVYYKKAVNIVITESIKSKNIFKDTPELKNPAFATNLFTILESILIFTFGRSLILIKYFNSFLGALLPVFIFLLAKIIFDDKRIARISAILVALLPSMVVWSSVGIKEPLIILLISGVFYYYIKNQKRFNFLYYGIIAFLAALLFYTQANVALILLIIYGLWFVFKKMSKFIKKEILVLILIFISTYAFLMNQKLVGRKLFEMAQHQAIQYRGGGYKSTRFELYPHEVIEKYFFNFYSHIIIPKEAYYAANADHNYIKNNIQGIRWVSFFVSYCKGFLYVLFSPFVWNINSLSQLIIYPQIIFWWGIIPCIIYGMAWSIRFKRNETILIILFIGSIYSVLALTEGNIGTLFRHKDWATPFCLMFAAVGINKFIFGYNIYKSGKGDLRQGQ